MMKLNLPAIPEGLKINIKGKEQPKKQEKPTYLAPNVREYFLHPEGSVRRIDLRGIARKDWRADRRQAKRDRISQAKYYKKLGKQLVASS